MYMYFKNVNTEVYLQYTGPGMSMLLKNLEFRIILMVLSLRFRDFLTHTSIKGGGICKHIMYIQ